MVSQADHKGVVLAGGHGTRLGPLSKVVSKHLLPLYDKPMIYYPISNLIAAGVSQIAIVTKPEQENNYFRLLGDGSDWGVNFVYVKQEEPLGIADALSRSEEFIGSSHVVLMLGDNLFSGLDLRSAIRKHSEVVGAYFYGYRVGDPHQYGVLEFTRGEVSNIIEKPSGFISDFAVPGVYILDADACGKVKSLTPSDRGEYEITDLLLSYVNDQKFICDTDTLGMAWLDTGNPDSLAQATEYVRVMQSRQGLPLGSPEVSSWQSGMISTIQAKRLVEQLPDSHYKQMLKNFWGFND